MDIQNFGSVDVQSSSEDINYELISFLNVFWEHKHPQSVVERKTADSKTNMLLEENKKTRLINECFEGPSSMYIIVLSWIKQFQIKQFL